VRRLNRPALVAITLVLLVLVVVGRLGAALRSAPAHARLAPQPALPGELTGPAPWPRNVTQLRARLAAIGLPALAEGGTRLHTHQHLDVFVHGRRVRVPAGIGIDAAGRFVSPLHTHGSTGVIHVESPTVQLYTLGELFAVWGVRFTPSCLGGYCAGEGNRLRVFVDGRPVTGDPLLVPLVEHEEIVVAFGTPAELSKPFPSSYPFPAGL
jgi:hypothetical protein